MQHCQQDQLVLVSLKRTALPSVWNGLGQNTLMEHYFTISLHVQEIVTMYGLVELLMRVKL